MLKENLGVQELLDSNSYRIVGILIFLLELLDLYLSQ